MISFAPLPRADVARVAHLQLPPEQRGFVGPIDEMSADPDPFQDFHIVLHNTETVGFFKIDRAFERIETRLPAASHGLRGLLIGGQYQRRGIGTEMLSHLPAYARQTYPSARVLHLRVDVENQPAVRAYLAHGWQMSDLTPAEGRSGPEHILNLTL